MPSSITITQFEPVVFMRGGTGRDARGRVRQINTSASPSHVRALLTLDLQKACKIKDIQVSFSGLTHTDWPEGIGPNRLELAETTQIFKNIITIWSAKEDHDLQVLQRRRANSIGPGVDGVTGDEDWSAFGNSGSANGSNPESTSHASGGGATGGGSVIGGGSIKKSIAGVAARAGTAIMPATIRNEINSSRKNSKHKDKDPSTSSPPRLAGRQQSAEGSSSSGSSLLRTSGILPRALGGASSSASAQQQQQHHQQQRSMPRPKSGSDVRNIGIPPAPISELPPTYDEAATPPGSNTPSASATQRRSYFDNHAGHPITISPATTPGPVVHFDTNALTSSSSSPAPASAPAPLQPSTSSLALSPTSSKDGHRKSATGSTLKNLIDGLLLPEKSTANNNHDDDPNGSSSSTTSSSTDWKLFKPGLYQFPINVQLPPDLPPTLKADFGHNAYFLRALVRRVGLLTPNLLAEKEVILIHSPEEDGGATNTDATDLIVVQREWESSLAYMVVVSGKTFTLRKSMIPLWMKLAPIDSKVCVHRITASIEERTSYFAKGRMTVRNEVPRRWNLLRLSGSSSSSSSSSGGEDGALPLLPILSSESDAIERSPLKPYVPKSSLDGQPDEDALSSLLDPSGPWELYLDLPLPTCNETSINISSSHTKANVEVQHTLRVSLRVSRAGNVDRMTGKPRQFDIIIEAPITLTSSHTVQESVALPNYWTSQVLGPAPGLGLDESSLDDWAEAMGASRNTGATSGGGLTPGALLPTGMARSSSADRQHGASSLSSSATPWRNTPPPGVPTRMFVSKRPTNTTISSSSPSSSAPQVGGANGSTAATRPLSPSSASRARSTLAEAAARPGLVPCGPGASADGESLANATHPERLLGATGTASSSSTTAATVLSSDNGGGGAPSLQNTARELSRQWLALSSATSRRSGSSSSSSFPPPPPLRLHGVRDGNGGVRVLAATPGADDDAPPPDYRSAVEAGQ
ncbi:hypothetical protein OC861_002919 [Tilletia horrida]|nr:hypothetical protein OC861_002919 [Tilletia horrida]